MTRRWLLVILAALVAAALLWLVFVPAARTPASTSDAPVLEPAWGARPPKVETAAPRHAAEPPRLPRGPSASAAVDAEPQEVSGKVVDAASGGGVAQVDVLFAGAGGETTASSGSDGSYSIRLQPGTYDVRAVGDGLVGLRVWRVPVVGAPVRFDVKVRALARVRGLVVDGRGRGVSEAEISYMPLSPSDQQLVERGEVSSVTSSGADGRFELPVLPGGAYLEATKRGNRGRVSVASVAPGATLHDIHIVLGASATLRGSVVDSQGRPVPDAAVHLAALMAGSREQYDTRTDDRGHFALADVGAGAVVVEARAAGHGQAAPQTVDLQPGSERSVTLRLQTRRTIAGRVVDAQGRPVAGVRIRGNRGSSKMPAFELKTAPDGRFAFEEADSGPYWLSASHPDYPVATREQVRAPMDDLEFRLERFGGLRGRVVAASGRLVEDFTVQVQRYKPAGVGSAKPGPPPTRYTSAKGRFSESAMAPGVYDLVISAPGFTSFELPNVEVPAGGWAAVEATLQPSH